MIKLKSLITEAGKIDRRSVKKEFDKFRRVSNPDKKDWNDLITSTIKHLGGTPTKRNIKDLGDHLITIYTDDEEFPRNFPDATDYKEMYELIFI